jgi:uncharacterized protein
MSVDEAQPGPPEVAPPPGSETIDAFAPPGAGHVGDGPPVEAIPRPPEVAPPPGGETIDAFAPSGAGSPWDAPIAEPSPAEVNEELAGPEPVRPSDRVASVDVMRGVALCGILAMNIVAFAWPEPAYGNPTRGAGFTGIDRAVWVFNHLFFEMKMMTTFSMLFGAGLVLMGDRADRRGASLVGTYYRRVLWLLAIGLVHAYLIWSGDILVLYAQCGLILYPFRRLSARTLVILGLATMLAVVPLLLGIVAGVNFMKANAARVAAKQKAGQPVTPFEAQMSEVWVKDLEKEFRPDPAKDKKKWDQEMAVFRSRNYWAMVKHRAPNLFKEHVFGLIFGGFFLAGGRMLFGMGLMKYGVFSAERSRRSYLWMMGLGYGIGLPLVAYDAYALIEHGFKMDYVLFQGGIIPNYVGSVIVAMGHIGLVMLICQRGWLAGLIRRLGAAGRMALTNYLTHSIVCTTIFYGYGLGYFGTINRGGLALIVLAIWTFQLIVSPIWLRHFRYGPAEWLWRSLTYGKAQPMRRAVEGLSG